MARRSTRNLILAFQAAEIDDQSIGPDVSEDVQMVYVMDDLVESTRAYGGVGGAEAAVIAEHGIISLQCRNTRGMIIDAVSIAQLPAFGNEAQVHMWTSAVVPTITGAAAPVVATGISEGPVPQANALIGTIATANLAASAVRVLNTMANTAIQSMFVANTRFFNFAFGTANVATELGIRWHELSRS